jgi:STE24 endopeptidase
VQGAFVADESRRSTRDNAYVAGLGATRRIVLFDTLLEHPVDTVEQVVAHELGHWRRHHLRKQVAVAAAAIAVAFAALWLVSEWTWLLDAAGLDAERAGVTDGTGTLLGDPAALPLLTLVTGAGFAVAGLLTAFVSRAFEREADLEAVELLARPDLLADMHRRIHVKNLADLDPTPFRYLVLTHPPAAERIALARAMSVGDPFTSCSPRDSRDATLAP